MTRLSNWSRQVGDDDSSRKRRRATLLAVLSLFGALGCGAAEQGSSGEGEAATTGEALSTAKFAGWSKLAGGPSFIATPAMYSSGNDTIYRERGVYATSSDGKIWSRYQAFGGSTDFGWSNWTQEVTPSGVTFTSSPAISKGWDATLQNNRTEHYSVLVARSNSAQPCPGCLYLQLRTHSNGTSWYLFPKNQDTTGDVSVVFYQDSLYMIAARAAGGSTFKYVYSTNQVTFGYDNSKWTDWVEIPGGGRFKNYPTGVMWPSGLLVVGLGTDNAIYGTALTFSTWDGYWWYGWGADTFSGSVGLTTATGWDMQLFARRTGNSRIAEGDLRTDGSFDGFYTLPGGPTTFRSGASAASHAAGHVEIAARGNDDAIWVNSYSQ